MTNLLRHTDLLCKLVTSLLIRRIQMREMSKLDWLTGLIKHAIWADSLYFLYLLLLSIYKILIFLEDPLFESRTARGCLFRLCSFCHILREWLHTHCAVCSGSLSGLVFMSELLRVCLVLKIVLMSYRFPIRLNFSATPFTYGIYTDPRGFRSLFRRLLPLELTTESMKPWG
jgi:hypothetical protein